jgi:hypothetical protein
MDRQSDLLDSLIQRVTTFYISLLHILMSPVTSSLGCLVAASNHGRSPSCGLRNCPWPQLLQLSTDCLTAYAAYSLSWLNGSELTACFNVSHRTAHTRGRGANFTDTTSAKRELAVNILRKVKSVKTTLSSTRFVQITKSSQDLVHGLPRSPGQLPLTPYRPVDHYCGYLWPTYLVLLVTFRHGPHRKHRFYVTMQLLPWKHVCLWRRCLITAIE